MTNLPFDLETREEAKMHSQNRVFLLKPMEGKVAVTASGRADSRLFTGENNLHAIWEPNKGSWFLRYDNGVIPAALDVRYLEFNQLKDFVTAYYAKRGIEVVGIKG